jgi:cation-transporting ATPase I
VGIAVGKDCTEAARGASDLVLADARIDTLVDLVVEGRAMWTAVRDAVSILVGGNLGEIGFTVAIGALTGSSPLTPRQLLLVNFLTDIAPSMAIALRPPSVRDLAALREATPQAALGQALDREIISRAIVTGMGAGGAWLAARMTGSRVRAGTVGLVGLVGSQLGQTLLKGGQSRSVVWTSIGSFAALGLLVQTPGVSQLFGCRPLGPIGWTTGLVSSAGATLLSPLVDNVVHRVADLAVLVREGVVQVVHTPRATRAEAAMRILGAATNRTLHG